MSGDRKHGRNVNRPANKRYTAEKRWEKNKTKAMKRHEKRMAAKSAKLIARASKPNVMRSYT